MVSSGYFKVSFFEGDVYSKILMLHGRYRKFNHAHEYKNIFHKIAQKNKTKYH